MSSLPTDASLAAVPPPKFRVRYRRPRLEHVDLRGRPHPGGGSSLCSGRMARKSLRIEPLVGVLSDSPPLVFKTMRNLPMLPRAPWPPRVRSGRAALESVFGTIAQRTRGRVALGPLRP